jgi:hypothetical protein
MSLDASGSVAGTLTFSKWKGRNYVRQLVTPSNPQSPLQISTRAMMKFLSQRWAIDCDATDQASYEAGAAADAISAFNEYIRTNIKNWTQYLLPSQLTPAARVATSPTFTVLPTATGGVGQLTITWTVNALNAGWGLTVHRKLAGAVTNARDNLVGVSSLIGGGAGSFVDTPLVPGTYHYNFRSFTDDGKASANLGATSAVVT